MAASGPLEKLLQEVSRLFYSSLSAPTCLCSLIARDASASQACTLTMGLRCDESLSATELAHHVRNCLHRCKPFVAARFLPCLQILRVCEGAVPVVPRLSNKSIALAASKLAETLLAPDDANKTFLFDAAGRQPVNRIDICRAALSLDPSCAEAYATLASLVGGNSVEVNGQRLAVVSLRDMATRLRFSSALAPRPAAVPVSASRAPPPGPASLATAPVPASRAPPPGPAKLAGPSAPTSAAPEVCAYRSAVAAALGLPPFEGLLPAVDRDVTPAWVRATHAGVTAPDPGGLPLSGPFTDAVEAVFAGGSASSVGAVDTLLGMSAKGGGVAGRRHASAQLYIALAFLSVDTPHSLDVQLAEAARAREAGERGSAEPPYMADARRALEAYQAAVISGAAFWDHSFFLIAAVHEVGRSRVTAASHQRRAPAAPHAGPLAVTESPRGERVDWSLCGWLVASAPGPRKPLPPYCRRHQGHREAQRRRVAGRAEQGDSNSPIPGLIRRRTVALLRRGTGALEG